MSKQPERQARKKREKGIPVRNKDTGRAVYVLPETLKEDSSRFEKIPESEVGDPRYKGKPNPPARPRKPDQPERPETAPPAPVHPPRDKPPRTPVKEVDEVPAVAPAKKPDPSPKRRWKVVKRYQPTAAALSVVARWLGRV